MEHPRSGSPQVGFPRIPRPVTVEPAPIPGGEREGGRPSGTEPESLVAWFRASARQGRRALPGMWKTLAIQLAVIGLINLVFWWYVDPFWLPAPLSTLAWGVIFLTAVYNDVIPKTIFWLVVLTVGKRVFFRVRREGLMPVAAQLAGVVPRMKAAMDRAAEASYALLLIGGGAGLVVANWFASYSRFSGARNKMDKYFVVIVTALAVGYTLGDGSRSVPRRFLLLASGDLARLLKKPPFLREEHADLLLGGFMGGLLFNGLLILMRLMYGGYMLGTVCLAGGIVLGVMRRKTPGTQGSAP